MNTSRASDRAVVLAGHYILMASSGPYNPQSRVALAHVRRGSATPSWRLIAARRNAFDGRPVRLTDIFGCAVANHVSLEPLLSQARNENSNLGSDMPQLSLRMTAANLVDSLEGDSDSKLKKRKFARRTSSYPKGLSQTIPREQEPGCGLVLMLPRSASGQRPKASQRQLPL